MIHNTADFAPYSLWLSGQARIDSISRVSLDAKSPTHSPRTVADSEARWAFASRYPIIGTKRFVDGGKFG
jgi:hypothetical protein